MRREGRLAGPEAGRLAEGALAGLGRRLSTSFLVAVIGRLMQLAMTVLLARQLGTAGYGTFAFALGVATIAAQFGSLGWPALAMRRLPEYLVGNNLGLLRGFLRAGTVAVLTGGTAVAMLLWAGSNLPGARETATGLGLAAAMILPMALRLLRRGELAGLHRPASGLAFDEIIAPGAVAAVALILPFADAGGVAMIYVAGSLIGICIATVAVAGAIPPAAKSERPKMNTGLWITAALPLLLGLSSRALMSRTDLIMLAPLSNMEQVGLYGAAMRMTYVLTFPQVVLMTALSPVFSDLLARGLVDQVRRQLVWALAGGVAVSVPFLTAALPFRDSLVSTVFGAGFAGSASTFVILAIAQAATALSIPCSALLVAAGSQKAFGATNAFAFAGNVGLNLWLIPEWGALGAAIATALCSCLLLGAQGEVVRRDFFRFNRQEGQAS
ncbi:MAG TPA: polysaccharide biosynthesis C-terminal domain-containing protein [Devosiaceae bacterium]